MLTIQFSVLFGSLHLSNATLNAYHLVHACSFVLGNTSSGTNSIKVLSPTLFYLPFKM